MTGSWTRTGLRSTTCLLLVLLTACAHTLRAGGPGDAEDRPPDPCVVVIPCDDARDLDAALTECHARLGEPPAVVYECGVGWQAALVGIGFVVGAAAGFATGVLVFGDP